MRKKAETKPKINTPGEGGAKRAGKAGRPTVYRPEFAVVARGMAKYGANDFDIAEEIGITSMTLWRWRSKYPEFGAALLEGKDAFDDRVERSLAQKAIGYTYHSEKIFHHEGSIIRVPIVEHYPPDVSAAKMWLGNRRPDKWKDKAEVELTGSEAFVAMWRAISSGNVPNTAL